MTGDDMDKWIDATLEGWDPSKEGWGPSELDDVEAGPPLSIHELKRAHEDSAVWRSPLDFRRTVARLLKRCLPSEIFNDPKRKFLLDAWVLAELSKHKLFTRLRLAGEAEQWPDGYAQTETGELKIEVTSALLPGRPLGAEYKLPGRMEYDPFDNWVKRADAIPGALEKAIGDKVKKRYGSPCALVVYLNISEYGIRQAETEQAIANIKDRYGLEFQYLWILWKGTVF
jgi:hypothetical protein